MKRLIFLPVILLVLAFGTYFNTDETLRSQLEENGIYALEMPAPQDSSKVLLGQKLFYDKILSGNRDISCATCHHPNFGGGDELRLPIGVGGEGLGSERTLGALREFIPRNSPEIFNRGAVEWTSMFWDSRVTGSPAHGYDTPVDEKLPGGLENILAVQAMFPVTSRDEMRGEIGDRDIDGKLNELALISNAAPRSMWMAIMDRLLAIPEYVDLFKQAYPAIQTEDLGFQHAANAIAAFEIEAFTALDSPWDAYLQGADDALNDAEKKGAILFYGEAGCVKCHSGPLMTDQDHHNIGVPQFGPGKDDLTPVDPGRFLESGRAEDKFAFRTPPLRNVAETGPWMHNGAYNDLSAAVRHHLDAEKALRNYDTNALSPELKNLFQDQETLIQRLVGSLDANVTTAAPNLNEQQLDYLMAFLGALTDSSPERAQTLVPESVPSGLAVDR